MQIPSTIGCPRRNLHAVRKLLPRLVVPEGIYVRCTNFFRDCYTCGVTSKCPLISDIMIGHINGHEWLVLEGICVRCKNSSGIAIPVVSQVSVLALVTLCLGVSTVMNGQSRKVFAYGVQIPSRIATPVASRVSVLPLVTLCLVVSMVMNGQSRKEFAHGTQISSRIATPVVLQVSVLVLVTLCLGVSTVMNSQSRKEFA